MPTADDLMREAHDLSDTIRRHRAGLRSRDLRGARELTALEAQLRDVWVAIRASRAPVSALDGMHPERRAQSKWG